MPVKSPPRHALGFLPTPVHPLPRFSAHLKGPRVLIKRDDQTGLAFGGNKTRKLEFLLGEALAQGCDTLITAGSAQSNHCRQTAAAAAQCGLACHLVLGGEEPAQRSGNLLLDDLLGAQVHWTGHERKGEAIPQVEAELRGQGRKPYVIPYGGSNAVGALGFVHAMQELHTQVQAMETKLTHLVFASSSGGTHAGLIVGRTLALSTVQLIGIAIDKEPTGNEPFVPHIAKLANETAGLLNISRTFSTNDVVLREEFLGSGYGVVGNAERRAIRTLAQTEGILLDPVYTGRAMAGLIGMIERGEFGANDTVLFWHTGGGPALFAYEEALRSSA